MPNLLVMYSNERPSEPHLDRLRSLVHPREVIVADSEAAALAHSESTDVILGHRYLRQTLARCRRLQWVQSTAAGVQHLIDDNLLRLRPRLTRAPIFSDVVAMHAFAMALAMHRRLPDFVLAQHAGALADKSAWARSHAILAMPRRAMVLGLGEVGLSIARTLRRNGITVFGMARNHTPDRQACCDRLLGPDEWRDHLRGVDLCFLALPETHCTRRLLDADALARLAPDAVVVNVGRGSVLDLPALVEALRSGALGGACLDVLDEVPPATDPLWTTPRLLITPKVAVFDPQRQQRLEQFIETQVQRFVERAPLLYELALEDLER